MSHRHTKLWVGIGTCVLLGSPVAQAETPAPSADTHAASNLLLASAGGEEGEHGGEGGEGAEGGGGAMSVFSSAGGEGGEGGEGGGGPSAVDSPGVYYTELALMLGHMSVGQELYESGHGDAGQGHLAHPVVELLPRVEPALEQRGLGHVVDALHQLADSATGESRWSEVEDAFQSARSSVLAAMKDVDASHRQDSAFLAHVLTAIALEARHEYSQAIEGGQFVEAEEYQDSRGFMIEGRALLERHAEVFQQDNEADYKVLVEHFEAIMEAWPTVQPPKQPALSVSELYGRVSAFEFVADRF